MDIIIFAVNCVTAAVCFYLLAVAAKDMRVREEHPRLSGRLVKIAICGILISQVGMVVLPEETEIHLSVFSISAMLALVSMAASYRKTYLPMSVEFVSGAEIVRFPSDKYAEVAPGVFCRHYKFDGVVLAGWEKKLIEIAKDYNPKDWDCIFFDIGRNKLPGDKTPDFKQHKHKRREITHLTKGRAVIIVGAPDLTPDLPFTVPPRTTHYFNSKMHCLGASFVERNKKTLPV